MGVAMSDLLHVGQISILAEQDRETIQDARRWLHYLFNQDKDLDRIEREGIFELIGRLNSLYARTASEPQISQTRY